MFIRRVDRRFDISRFSVHKNLSGTCFSHVYSRVNEHLRALRRQAERKARRTWHKEDIAKARNIQRRVAGIFTSYTRNALTHCVTKLVPRKPLSISYQMVRGLRTRPQQFSPFRSLDLSRGVSDLCIDEELCANMSSNSAPVRHSCTLAMACVTSGTMMNSMDTPFGLQELKKALVTCNSSSSPRSYGTRYASLHNLGEYANYI